MYIRLTVESMTFNCDLNVQLKVKVQDEDVKVRRQSSPAFQSQQTVSNPQPKTSASHSKPQLPPHPSLSPELAKLIHTYKTRTPSNDIHVIDSRSKNPSQVSTVHQFPRLPNQRNVLPNVQIPQSSFITRQLPLHEHQIHPNNFQFQ